MRPVRSLLPLAAAASCGALGAILCWNYPIAPVAMLVAFAAWSVAVFWRPWLWLVVVPAIVPLIGFASWTGWLTFEELDILALGTAAGAYARGAFGAVALAGSAAADGRDGQGGRLSIAPLGVAVLYLILAIVSVYRGIVDAGGLSWGWFQGYYEALNSLRVAKPLLVVAMLAPLMLSGMRSNRRANELMAGGLTGGAAVVSILVLWERAAFPGVLNFSTDYRATALFWEMHVGGAALDGFLMLTAPFALWFLLQAKTPWKMALATAVVAAVAYASLATFSRGVYLALPISFLFLFALLYAQRKSKAPVKLSDVAMLVGLPAASAVVSYLAFRAGGYRTLGAVLCTFAVSILLAPTARKSRPWHWVYAIGAGVAMGAAGVVVASALPKGAYVVFAVALALCAAILLRQSRDAGSGLVTVSLATYVWLLIAAADVAFHWGGAAALEDSLAALAFLTALFAFSARASRPIWPEDFRARMLVVGSAAAIAGTVAIFFGGAYMTDRFASSEGDLALRMHHWRSSIGLLHGPLDWLLGKGVGRFPASYYFGIPDIEMPGSYRLNTQGSPFLVLSGPTHPIIWIEAFRVSQRVPANAGAYTVSFEARARKDVELNVEICEKQLLYKEGFVLSQVVIKNPDETWKRMTVVLDGKDLTGGPWYAPRLAFFSMAVETAGASVDVRDVTLVGPTGRSLITNGDFSSGMAHWFFTSDRGHLPWHIKNLALNVLFDQGMLGLACLTGLVCIALWRLVVGHARGHPLAPYVAAALGGFLVVGMFDSLLDVPRVAFLFYLLLLWGLALRDRSTFGDGT